MSQPAIWNVRFQPRFTNPPLTTIAQPRKEIGAQALNLLVGRMAQKSRLPSRLVLPPELIVRRSTQQAA